MRSERVSRSWTRSWTRQGSEHHAGRKRSECGYERWGVQLRSCIVVLMLMWLFSAPAMAQEDTTPLIDSPPYDIVVLKATAGGKSVRIAPLLVRSFDKRPADTERLQVVILTHPERKYEVLWRDVERVDFFETMIYDEATRKLVERDFISAFMNLSYLMQNYPKTPNLEKLRRDFMFQSAAAQFAESKSDFNRNFQAMATLEELHATAPEYEVTSVLNGLSRVTDSLIRYYQSKGDMASAKQLLDRLSKTYGDKLQSVVEWKGTFLNLAQQRKAQAIELMNSGKYREARRAAIDMSNISSEIEGGAELIAEIRRRHPMVRVGVTQKAGAMDPGNLFNWAGRRAGMLVYRPVVKFLDTGNEGGKYQFALGKMKLSEDNLQLTLNIDPDIPAVLTGYDLAQDLAARATPGDAQYDASWAAIVKSISTPGPTQLLVRLQRPHVLPQALMQFSYPDTPEQPSMLAGMYKLNAVEGDETSFVIRKREENAKQPVEIVEVFYEDPKVAVNDLLRGEIDALDRIYPADARSYEVSKSIKLGEYLLPSVHMLVPVSEHPYLAKEKFRRALMYASNRAEILRGELINSDVVRDGRLISGPFPMGAEENDPLNYAYDASIAPKAYDPRLAKLLTYMAEKEVRAQSAKMKVPVPENRPLKIGIPNFEVAKVAVQALIQQWSLVGIKAETILLPEGMAFDPELGCDLVYVSANMWEPAIDIERLLGGASPAAAKNPFIVQALTKIRKASSWRETRVALQNLHQLVDYHLPILPLWQISDHFAYSPVLQGIGKRSVTLYDHVQDWRLGTSGLPVASQ